jgi:outer membrane protein assembly factor BamB
MRKALILSALVCFCAALTLAQSRGGNWPTFGGDAQRSGWQGADTRIAKDTVKDLQLLFKLKLEFQAKGSRPLMPPLILGRLISYRGFRELAFVGSNADMVYALDADLGTVFWQKHLEYSTRDPQILTSTAECPGGMTAVPTMPVPGGAAAPRGAPRGGPFIAGPASVYAISSDGRLHRLNTSTGDDIVQPVQVLPANAKASSMNMLNGVIYTVTSSGCNETQDAVWAIDVAGDVPTVKSHALTGDSPGLGSPVIGADGTVYVQTSDKLLALNPGDLALKGYFTTAGAASPVAFQYKNRELIVNADKQGRLILLDSTSFAGNHETPLFRTAAGSSIYGSLSTWQEMDGTRWILAPVWGRMNAAPNGSIAAFKVEEQGGKAVLSPSWVSRDMHSPLPPVISSGVVFALSAGEFTRERPKSGTRATLHALDAATGKELYSSRNLVTSAASLAGITVSNGRLYFSTLDGTFYAFGMYMEQ